MSEMSGLERVRPSAGSPVGDYPHRSRFTGKLEEVNVELR